MTRRLVRILALCWAVASAGMPGVLAVADAAGESRGAHTGIGHVEAPDRGACPLAHDAHCAVCALLRHHAPVLAHGASPDWPQVVGTPLRWNGRDAAATAARRTGRPRAPPSA